jgi:ferrous iron transport protein B
MTLYELNPGQTAVIIKIHGSGSYRKRLIDMGFIRGKEVAVVKKAPLQDPIQYEIMGYQVSLRGEEAKLVDIVLLDSERSNIDDGVDFNGVVSTEKLRQIKDNEGQKTINVVLVGNPNCGKTSIFNYISGSREHVGNYPGVTVDAKRTQFKYGDYKIRLVDLPGTYSISAYTPEEVFVREFLTSEKTDVVINVVDCSNLERNLYLTTQLLDLDLQMVMSLNMYDELELKGDQFDYEHFSEMIGVPAVPTVGKKGKGMKELLDKVVQVYENKEPIVRHVHIHYGTVFEESISKLEQLIEESNHFPKHIHTRFIALKLLEKDVDYIREISSNQHLKKLKETVFSEIDRIEGTFSEDTENLTADLRYGFIEGAMKETYKQKTIEAGKLTKSKKLDLIFTHKYWGLPIFIFVLWLMFFSTFTIGGFFMEWIEAGVEVLGNLFMRFIPEGVFQDMLVEGVIGGVGGVIVFLPNIVILFLCIALMEGTGYMARIAFIMDRLMHKVGLHGKSFIPLIMGFGCNVPAIMATRTLENKSDRILTMLIIPLMSCSARLPVYVLLVAAFFPENPALMIMLIYFLGIFFAAFFALLFKKLFFNKNEAPFVMELPPYRTPTLKATYLYMWLRASQYLKKMGGIILIASIIIWVLGYFPRNIQFSKDYESHIAQVHEKYNNLSGSVHSDDSLAVLQSLKVEELTNIVRERELERHSKTYIGILGKMIQPIMEPLGMDWRLSISLLSGFPAKEVIISTMGVLFQDYELDPIHPDTDNPKLKIVSLDKRLQEAVFLSEGEDGSPLFTKVSAFAFLLFVLFYFPCTASVVAIKKETAKWSFTILSIVYTTGFAWLMSYLANTFGHLIF